MVGVRRHVCPGDIWLTDLNPVVGHEQAGVRPAVVVSSGRLHSLPIRMLIVVPLTGTDRGVVTQPRVDNSGSGLRRTSFARPEDVRSVDMTRLQRKLGEVTSTELADIRKVLRYFLDL